MRLKLLILFLLVCVLKLTNCDNDLCFEEKLKFFLVETEDDEHNKYFNRVFENTLKHLPAMEISRKKIHNTTLKEALNKIKPPKPNVIVIHLYVKDFYRNNYNDILNSNFIYAGDIGEETKIAVCRSISTAINKTEACQKSHETQRYAKLVSKNILNYPTLLNLIYNFDGKIKNYDVNKSFASLEIGVCGIILDNTDLEYYQEQSLHMDIGIQYEYDCEKIKTDKMIALVTPKPFKTSERFNTTTIFYDEQGTISPEDKDMFPNAILAVNSLDPLKLAFYKFMQENNWNRVAIISDDSEKSKKIENDLTTLFDNKNVVYASVFCDGSNCDFSKILRRLVMAEAKVVIANVGNEYVHALAQEASKWHTQKRGFVWLFSSQQMAIEIAPMTIGHIFSITLEPDAPVDFSFRLCSSTDPCNLLAALDAVKKFLEKNCRNINPEKLLDYNYSKFLSKYIKSFLVGDNYVISYINFHRENEVKFVAQITFGPSGVEYYKNELQLPYFRTELKDCIFKSNVYFKMCNDMEVIFITLVIAVFALSALGIVYFFQMSDRSYSRMPC